MMIIKRGKMEFTKKELKFLKSLNTPKKIQDFLNKLEINFDYRKDTCISPINVLRKRKCHCIEGAIFATFCLKLNGYKPLIVDLEATEEDFDHVIAVFKENGKWGSISKTNHAVLRYREPVYNSIRELIMSFFHEYFTDKGTKTLRAYSRPINLSKFDNKKWETDKENLWYIAEYIANAKHIKIMNKKQIKNLRKADKIEIIAGKLVEWKPYGKRIIK
jgi:hypothetical protein